VVGGLVGALYEDSRIINSFWDIEKTGIANAYGFFSYNSTCYTCDATPLTTAQSQQQSSYAGWDFIDTWVMPTDGGTPILRVFLTSDNVNPGTGNRLVMISDAATSGLSSFTFNNSGQIIYIGSTDAININIDDLKNAIATVPSDKYMVTSTGGITLADSIQLGNTFTYNFTLRAAGNIALNGGIDLARGNLDLVSTAGSITVNGNIIVDGNITLQADQGAITINNANGKTANLQGHNVALRASQLSIDHAAIVGKAAISLDADTGIIGGGASLQSELGTISVGITENLEIAEGAKASPRFSADTVRFHGGGVITMYPYAIKTRTLEYGDDTRLEGAGSEKKNAPHIFGLANSWFTKTEDSIKYADMDLGQWPHKTLLLESANGRIWPNLLRTMSSAGLEALRLRQKGIEVSKEDVYAYVDTIDDAMLNSVVFANLIESHFAEQQRAAMVKALVKTGDDGFISPEYASLVLPYARYAANDLANIPQNAVLLKNVSYSSGFQGMAYYDPTLDGGTIVITYAGSNEPKDFFGPDAGIALNIPVSQQWRQALQFYQEVLGDPRVSHGDLLMAKIVITGHSLGGGLAQVVGAITGNQTYAFNSSEVPSALLGEFPTLQNTLVAAMENILSLGVNLLAYAAAWYVGNVPAQVPADNIHIIRTDNDPVSGGAALVPGAIHATNDIVNIDGGGIASHRMYHVINGLMLAMTPGQNTPPEGSGTGQNTPPEGTGTGQSKPPAKQTPSASDIKTLNKAIRELEADYPAMAKEIAKSYTSNRTWLGKYKVSADTYYTDLNYYNTLKATSSANENLRGDIKDILAGITIQYKDPNQIQRDILYSELKGAFDHIADAASLLDLVDKSLVEIGASLQVGQFVDATMINTAVNKIANVAGEGVKKAAEELLLSALTGGPLTKGMIEVIKTVCYETTATIISSCISDLCGGLTIAMQPSLRATYNAFDSDIRRIVSNDTKFSAYANFQKTDGSPNIEGLKGAPLSLIEAFIREVVFTEGAQIDFSNNAEYHGLTVNHSTPDVLLAWFAHDMMDAWQEANKEQMENVLFR
jgi:hypothetical protein